MSAFDRIEQRMPELMADLAPASVPDYFDDMLRQAGRMRQRPAWASLERWLPMDVVARPVLLRAPALRPLLVLLLVLLLVAAGLLLFAGSQRTRLPEPFGLARNGVILLGTSEEDIVAFDPVTGTTTTLIGGPTRDIAPWFSRDGSKFMFVRLSGDEIGSYWLANADGSDARAIAAEPVDWFEFDDAGMRILLVRLLDGEAESSVVDVASGASTVLHLGDGARALYWRPGHDQILYKTSPEGGPTDFYLVNADGSNARMIEGVSPDAINDAQFSPDGSQLTYASWGQTAGSQGRIHVLDIESGEDRVLMFEGSDGSEELSPQFSPDGASLIFERYVPGDAGYQLVVGSLDGSGGAQAIGPRHATGTNGAAAQFSPDGTQILSVYNDDGAAWLLDVDGGGEERLDWSSASATWQRLAP